MTTDTELSSTLWLGLGGGIAVFRVFIVVSTMCSLELSPTSVDIFKDLAHIYIGALGASAWHVGARWKWYLFWVMNAIEVACAIATKVLS